MVSSLAKLPPSDGAAALKTCQISKWRPAKVPLLATGYSRLVYVCSHHESWLRYGSINHPLSWTDNVINTQKGHWVYLSRAWCGERGGQSNKCTPLTVILHLDAVGFAFFKKSIKRLCIFFSKKNELTKVYLPSFPQLSCDLDCTKKY